ncbi:CopD family protein [Bacillus sp. 31A1R]|uniref:CopD family protein n=1 Tax=Robertmurraya mangrovi TaxID=3098077 RepID=A0ABU5J477_9BACI|nr:CopD family protein [Bacillus sp. 31A1R]MDZ5474176.1 CopD family protein [Bacillus sp. 31A1R]
MVLIGIISQALLYFCFALLVGSFLLYIVPSIYRPDINVPKGALMLALGGIAILSFIPVFQVILHLYQDIGLARTFQSVIFTFEIGKSWVFTYIIANILFIFVVWFDYRKNSLYSYIGIILTFILILALGWSSHASSYVQIKGFFSHTTHFTAVSLWVGILMVVSWFSNDKSNWHKFLKWFTPVALLCFGITIVTGLVLMSFVMEFKDYTNSWMIPYGQALLIKHLLIIPLLLFASFNSLFIRKKLNNVTNFNPIPWLRIESIVILFIFSATAALGQQSPPHESTLTNEGVSKLFLIFYQGQFTTEMKVDFVLNWTSISFFMFSVLFLVLIVLSFIKKAPARIAFLMALLFVVCGYLSLILSIK